MNNVSEKSTWSQVSYFRVYKETIDESQPRDVKVFNNGLQQCRIKVGIAVQDSNGNDVDLPEADLWNLQLIDYNSGNPLPVSWQVSRSANEYEWDESIIPGSAVSSPPEDRFGMADDEAAGGFLNEREPKARRETIFYVATTLNSPARIAARMPLPRGGYAMTNIHTISDPDGLGDGNGNFNSSVRVVPTAFPVLPISHYGDSDTSGNLVAHRVGNSNNFYVVNEYYLFVNLNGRELRLKMAIGVTQNPFVVWKKDNNDASAKFAFSYHSQPNKSDPDYLPAPPLRLIQLTQNDGYPTQGDASLPSQIYQPHQMFENAVGTIVGRSPTRVVIGLIVSNLPGRFLDIQYNEIADVPSTSLWVQDVYGNYHTLNLHFGARVNQLKITAGRSGEDQVKHPLREDSDAR